MGSIPYKPAERVEWILRRLPQLEQARDVKKADLDVVRKLVNDAEYMFNLYDKECKKLGGLLTEARANVKKESIEDIEI